MRHLVEVCGLVVHASVYGAILAYHTPSKHGIAGSVAKSALSQLAKKFPATFSNGHN